MTGKEPSPIKNIIPEALKYYVPRRLITRNVLTEELFQRSSDLDTFLFTGIERYDLSSKLGGQRTDTTSNQLDNRDTDVKHLMLVQPNHFSKFHSLLRSPVHHIQFEEDKFYWVKSMGSLDKLRRHMDKTCQMHLTESEFLTRICSSPLSNLPVCISDSPGMGKSEILKQITRKIVTLLPGRIVIFQEFPKFIDVVQQTNKVNSDLKICVRTALQQLACKGELGSIVLNSNLESEIPTIELLLDGYDELNWASFKIANELLTEIHSSLKSVRLWVTTRPHLLQNLENMFTVFGYTIRSFTTADQINFLLSYWSREKKYLPMDKLTQYAANCLTHLKSTLSAKEEDIAGIPLQCLMIGEVYEEEAVDYARSDAGFSGITIRVTSITDLYKLTIEKKIRKYQSASTYSIAKLSKDELINMHIQMALKLILPEYFAKAKLTFKDISEPDMLNVGVLESKMGESELVFIHRTFAEYFVALFVVNVLNGKSDDDHDSLTVLPPKEVFECKETRLGNEFKYPVICFFINSLLQGREVQNNIAQAYVDLFEGLSTMMELTRSCVNSDFANIFILFERANVFEIYGKAIFSEDLALEAITNSGVQLIRKTIGGLEQFNKTDFSFKRAALIHAVRRCEFTPVEFLLNEKKMHTIINDGGNYQRLQILHYCVENSKENPDQVIREKIEVIKFIVRINHHLLEEKNSKGCTPLVCNKVHVHLLIKLIELGSNVFATDGLKRTILHFTNFSPEEYHSLLASIKIEDLVTVVKVGEDNGDTPLLRLIKGMDPEEETLNIFRDAGADFNIRDKIYAHSLLAFAIENGRNMTTLRKLIQCGSDVKWLRHDEQNLMHIAYSHCNLDAISVLSEYTVDINAVDNFLDTPLHTFARFHRRATCSKVIKNIIEYGGNVTMQNSNGDTFLHELFYRDHISSAEFHNVIELMLHLKCSHVLEIDNNIGNSPIMVAIEHVDVEVETLSLLRKHGLNLLQTMTVDTKSDTSISIGYMRNYIIQMAIADRTLLHAACANGNHKVIPFLLGIGLHVNQKDSASMMPLHYASTWRGRANFGNRWKTIKVLIENGADAYAKKDDDTFLHRFLSGKLMVTISAEELHELTEFLVKNGHAKLFNIKGRDGVTSLHLAVILWGVKDETISLLNSSGVRFDCVDDNGNSVLAYAIQNKRNINILQSLIKYGANVKQTNNIKKSLLHFAAEYQNVDAIKLILDSDINVNGTDRNGDTPLHSCVQRRLSSKADKEFLGIINLLVGKGASVTMTNKLGMSPFSLAKKKLPNSNWLLQFLSNRLAEEMNNRDENRNSVLHNAVSSNDFVLVKELVGKEVDVNAQNNKLETSLHLASSMNDKGDALKIIRLLIDANADPYMKDEKDQTFLHILLTTSPYLSPSQFHDFTGYLIDKGHSRLLETDGWNYGVTPIHLALFYLELKKETLSLLSSQQIDWDFADHRGRVPLCFAACSKYNSSLLSQLVEQGADYRAQDTSGNNLLHYVAEIGNIDALNYLLRLGLNVNDANSGGNTPLHVALLKGRKRVVKIARILDKAGADSNLRNNEGQTPFALLLERKIASPIKFK